MKVLIASENTAKIKGAEEAFQAFKNELGEPEVEGIGVESNVPDQPLNEQIQQGAVNRVENLKKEAMKKGVEADFFVSIESGITNQLGNWFIINIACVENKKGERSFGVSSGFPVPKRYVEEIIDKDLSVLMDQIFQQKDLRLRKGGIHFLTHGVVSRIDLTKEAFCMALTQFVNGEIWK